MENENPGDLSPLYLLMKRNLISPPQEEEEQEDLPSQAHPPITKQIFRGEQQLSPALEGERKGEKKTANKKGSEGTQKD